MSTLVCALIVGMRSPQVCAMEFGRMCRLPTVQGILKQIMVHNMFITLCFGKDWFDATCGSICAPVSLRPVSFSNPSSVLRHGYKATRSALSSSRHGHRGTQHRSMVENWHPYWTAGDKPGTNWPCWRTMIQWYAQLSCACASCLQNDVLELLLFQNLTVHIYENTTAARFVSYVFGCACYVLS